MVDQIPVGGIDRLMGMSGRQKLEVAIEAAASRSLDEGITISIPPCSPACPDPVTWPSKNLIMGACPACGWGSGCDGAKAVRALAAKRLLAARSS